jgi:exodeoxyribonuclease VII small subunit
MPEKEFDFDKAFRELEKINEWFQGEEVDLNKGLKMFRKGLKLIKQCRERLKEVENEFQELKKEFSVDKPLEKEE